MADMIEVTAYDKGGATPGAFTHGWTNTIEEIVKMVDPGTTGIVLGNWNSDFWYAENGQAVQRPILAGPTFFEIHANDSDAVHITGIPVGSKFSAYLMDVPKTSPLRDVHVDIQVDDGIIDWTTAYAGRYSLYIQLPWPYQPWTGEAIVIDPSL